MREGVRDKIASAVGLSLILGGLAIPTLAKAEERVDVTTLPRTAFSYGNSPKNDEDAKRLGYLAKPEEFKSPHGENVKYYVRETEIVPIGDEPKAEGVKRYIRDDGTFVDPNEASKKGMRAPYRSFGAFSQLPVPAYTYNDEGLKEKYLPRNGYANIAVFWGREPQDQSTFYCINPNSSDPNNEWYIQEPTRFSGQTNFQDLPEIPYIMDVMMEKADMNKTKPVSDLTKGYGALRAAYNEISNYNWTDKQARLDPRLTNGEVAEQFNKIVTRHGKPTVVDGENIPVQSDWNTGSYINIEDWGDHDDTVTLGIEYAFNHYTQGFPIGGLDRYQAVGGFWGYKTERRTLASRAFARIIFAYVEAARARGLLDRNNISSSPLKSKVTDTKEDGANTIATVELSNTDDATSLEAILPANVTVVNTDVGAAKSQQDKGTFRTYTWDKPLKQLKLSVPTKDIASAKDIKGTFIKHYIGSMIGKSWLPRDAYRFDQKSGHWIVKEFSSFNKLFPDYARWGMSRGQQVVNFSSVKGDVTAPFTLTVFSDEKQASASTNAAVNGIPNKDTKNPATINYEGLDDLKSLSDIVNYEHFTAGKKYKVAWELKNWTDNGTKVVGGEQDFTAGDDNATAGSAVDGSWTIALSDEQLSTVKQQLKSGKTYGFTVKITGELPGITEGYIEHGGADVAAENFVVSAPEAPKGKMITLAGAGGKSATINPKTQDVSQIVRVDGDLTKVAVSDQVFVYQAMPNATYNLKAELMEVNGTTVTPVKNNGKPVTGEAQLTTSRQGSGTATVELGTVKLEADKTYVIYETATSVKKYPFAGGEPRPHVMKHHDPNARSQLILTRKPDGKDAKMSTSAVYTQLTWKRGADGKMQQSETTLVGAPGKPVPLYPGQRKITDRITYTGFIPGTYKFTSTLYKTNGKKDLTGAKVVLTKETTKEITDPDGSVELNLGTTTEALEANTNYVLTETAVLVKASDPNNHNTCTAKHEDGLDLAQTYSVGPSSKMETHIQANGTEATGDEVNTYYLAENGNVPVKDRIIFHGLIPGAEYKLVSQLVKITGPDKYDVIKTVNSTFANVPDTGTTTIDFGEVPLEAGSTYVALETITSTEKLIRDDNTREMKQHVIEHVSLDDKQQTVKVLKPELKTTVNAKDDTGTINVTGSDKAAATISSDTDVTVNVTDTVDYKNLYPGKTYTFTGKLMEVNGDTATPVVNNSTEVTATKKQAADQSGNGQVAIDFGKVTLQPGKTYVVYETAVYDSQNDSGDKKPDQTVKHENPKDKAQTVVVKKTIPDGKNGKLQTTVNASNADAKIDVTGNNTTPATITSDKAVEVTVVDTIAYEGLVPNEEYTFTGQLMDATNPDKPVAVGEAVEKKVTVTAATGTYDMEIGKVKLEPGKTYVVYEKAVSTNPVIDSNHDGQKEQQKLEHKNPKDNAQTVVVKKPTPDGKDANLKTTVTVKDGNGKAQASGSVNAPATITLDKAAEVHVVDTVTYQGLVPGEEYTISGKLMDVTDPAKPSEVATASVIHTPQAANGTVEVDFGKVKLQPEHTYVVYEHAVSTNAVIDKNNDGTKEKQELEHKDPGDKAQTVVVKKTIPDGKNANLQTTVNASNPDAKINATGTKDEPATITSDKAVEVTVVDTITYKGLIPNEEYTFTGQLMDVTDPANPTKVGDPVSHNVLISTADGTYRMEFGKVSLEPGKTYVVYETADSVKPVVDQNGDGKKEQHHVEHKNPKDKAQTVVVKKPEHPKTPDNGRLQTTVNAKDDAHNINVTGSDNAPATITSDTTVNVNLVDTVDYSGLVPGEEYTFTGQLMDVTDPANPVEVGLAVMKKITVGTATGQFEVDFGKVTLQPGRTYVVYETAESVKPVIDKNGNGKKEKQKVEHKNPKDKAQTVVVKKPEQPKPGQPSLRTTVSVGDVQGSVNHAATIETAREVQQDVVDTITYTGLVAGQEYTFNGRLMDVTDPAKPVEAATASVKVTVPKADGEAKVTFAKVKLVPGHKYVVFETATSTNPVVTDKNGKKVVQVIKHENPNDLAQTVVVKHPAPAKPKLPKTGSSTLMLGGIATALMLMGAISLGAGWFLKPRRRAAHRA